MIGISIENAKVIFEGLWYTTLISSCAFVFGTIGGVGLCALELSKKKSHNLFAKYYIAIVRGLPASVLLMLLFYVVFVGWNPLWPALITFILQFATHVGEVFYIGYKSVNPKQYVAGLSLGMSRYMAFRLIVLPQMMRNCAPALKDHVGGLIAGTSIVGYISVVDLTKAVDLITSASWDPLIPIVFVGLVYLFYDWGSGKLVDYIINKL